jgi:hypothetical protein
MAQIGRDTISVAAAALSQSVKAENPLRSGVSAFFSLRALLHSLGCFTINVIYGLFDSNLRSAHWTGRRHCEQTENQRFLLQKLL